MDIEHFNRLTTQGLSAAVSIQIIEGKLDEKRELERLKEGKLAAEWCRSKANRLLRPCPVWDFDPGNFHLAGDGLKVSEFNHAEHTVLFTTTSEICENLLGREWIEADPWLQTYRSKTAVIAFRWCHGLPVTPPLIAVHDGKLVVAGGNHRLRYANFCRADRIPFLVARDQTSRVKAMLRSASSTE
jgi:hypothetical protein